MRFPPGMSGVFEKAAALQPPRSRYGLNSKDKDTPAFQRQVREVCDTYQKAPERLPREGIHTVCVDEKTGMQARERAAETLPMKPGLPEAREHDYIRHGTLCRTANFEVATGAIVAPTVDRPGMNRISRLTSTGPWQRTLRRVGSSWRTT